MSAAPSARDVEIEAVFAALGDMLDPRVHVRWRDGSVSRHEIDSAGRATMTMGVSIGWFCLVPPWGQA